MSKVQKDYQAIIIRQGKQIRSFQQKTIGNFLGRFKSILLGSAQNRIRNIEQQRQLNNLARLSKLLMCPQQLEYFETLAGDNRLKKIIFWSATLGLQPVFVDNKIKLTLINEVSDLKLQGYKEIGTGSRKVIQFETVSNKRDQLEPWQETIVEFAEKYQKALKKQRIPDSVLKLMFILMISGVGASQVLELPFIISIVLFFGGLLGPLGVLDHRDRLIKNIYISLKKEPQFPFAIKPNKMAKFIMELGDPRCEKIIIKYIVREKVGQVKEFVRHPNLLPGLETSSLPPLEAPVDIPQLTSGNKENEVDE